MEKRANFRLFENLKNCFRVKAIVSDDYSANVLSCKLLLKELSHFDDNLFILLHDAVHMIKNVGNNLLNYKRFIFLAFKYDGFEDSISFKGSQIS